MGFGPAIKSWVPFVLLLAVGSACQKRLFSTVTLATDPFASACSQYSQFIPIANSANAAAAIQAAINATPQLPTCIYLSSPSAYKVNLVLRDRTAPLFIHGIIQGATQLTPLDPGLPALTVNEAGLINLAGLSLSAPTQDSQGNFLPDFNLVQFNNRKPIRFQLQEAQVVNSPIRFTTPGTFRLQGVFGRPCGISSAAFIADHPQADLVIVGGNVYNNSNCRAQLGEYHHVWKKQGRLRLFNVGFQINPGAGDIRIDHASTLGPDQIGYVRSEGTGALSGSPNDGVLPSGLLVVPPTSEKVDVVLVASVLDKTTDLNRKISAIADYSATGTLWLVSNTSFSGSDMIVKGAPPAVGATVVALGNYISSDTNAFRISPAQLLYASNLYDYCTQTLPAPCSYPRARNIAPGGTVTNLAGASPARVVPPALEIPLPLGRPEMNRALPGLVNVRDLGAKGDGVTDDTAAIQSALDYTSAKFSQTLFFPAGVYRITAPLKYTPSLNHVGGWFAGEGPGRSVIRRDPTSGVGVFYSSAFAYMVVQGLKFETAAYNAKDAAYPRTPNFDVEYIRGTGPASQENMFFDVVFDGGYDGIAFGDSTTESCSENMIINSVFRNTAAGLNSGSYNALNNVVYNGRFENVAQLLRNGGNGGGSYSIFHGTATGATALAFETRESAERAMLIYKLTTDSPSAIARGYSSGARFGIYLESVRFTGPMIQYPFDSTAGTSISFVRSTLPNGAVHLNSSATANTFFKLGSVMPDWASSRATAPQSTLTSVDAP